VEKSNQWNALRQGSNWKFYPPFGCVHWVHQRLKSWMKCNRRQSQGKSFIFAFFSFESYPEQVNETSPTKFNGAWKVCGRSVNFLFYFFVWQKSFLCIDHPGYLKCEKVWTSYSWAEDGFNSEMGVCGISKEKFDWFSITHLTFFCLNFTKSFQLYLD
jgi:hypothetical protein